MKKVFIAITTLFLLIVLVAVLFYFGFLHLNNPSFTEYPVQGIDISNHQGVIDWEKLDKRKVQFAFIKSTEGGDFKDKLFAENLRNARLHDIPVGAYHFFTFCKSGEEQAKNFIEAVPKDYDLMLPPVIDVEYGGNCKLVRTKEDVVADLKTMIAILEKEYGKKVIIYVTRQSYEDFIAGNFTTNPLWFRGIYALPDVADNRQWTFWQHTNRGRMSGINTLIDLNVYRGSRFEFEKQFFANHYY